MPGYAFISWEREKCKEGHPDETVNNFGDIIKDGMRIESRKQLEKKNEWGKEWKLEIMKTCRGYMARRIQIGAERWKGNERPTEKGTETVCRWCKKRHGGNFYEMMMECKKIKGFREEVMKEWKWSPGKQMEQDIIFGRINKKWWDGAKKSMTEEKLKERVAASLKWWEKRIGKLRKELAELEKEETIHESDVEEETDEETSDSGKSRESRTTEEEKGSSSEDSEEEKVVKELKKAANKIRKFDKGVVKKGEPDIILPKNRGELKKFLDKKKM